MQLNKFTIIFIILPFLFLSGCGGKTLTGKVAIETKKQISSLQQQVKNSSCKNDEKDIFYKQLDKITENVNLITSSCEMEKFLLKEKVAKLNWLLLFILGGLLIMKGKKLCMN